MDNEQKNVSQPTEERYAAPEIEDNIIPWDTDEAPTEWVPTRFEKRVNAIPEKRWLLYQTLGGAVVGAVIAVLLFVGGQGFSAGLLIAVALAMLLPNWLENRARRNLKRARLAMIVVLALSIVVYTVWIGQTRGWDFFTKKETAQAFILGLRVAG